MADNYTQSATFIPLPEGVDKRRVQEVINAGLEKAKQKAYEDDPDYAGDPVIEITAEAGGVYVCDYAAQFDTEAAEFVIRELVEQFELEDTVVCNWAYTCSKHRDGQFGGGAFAMARGKETVWVDLENIAITLLKMAGPFQPETGGS